MLSLQGGCFTQFAYKETEPTGGCKRAKHRKSFNGCLACKKRRVRCSEGKPSCVRCVRGGTRCEYKPLKVWLFESDATPSLSKALGSTLTMMEQRSLLYYRERAAPLFSFYFGKSFFQKIVLQLRTGCDAIKNAIMAAATLVESIDACVSQRSQVLATFYSTYNKAIVAIHANKNPSSQFVLTSCALFASVEMTKGSVAEAVRHIKAGLSMLASRLEWLHNRGEDHCAEARFLRESIQPVMAGLAVSARVFGANILPPSQIAEIAGDSSRYELPYVPSDFVSIFQAHHSLTGILHHMSAIEGGPGCGYDIAYVRKLSDLFHQWTNALHVYVQKLSPAQFEARHAEIAVVCSNYAMARMFLMMEAFRDSEADFNDIVEPFVADFDEMIRLYTNLQPKLKWKHTASRYDENSSIIECIPPLFLIAICTPDTRQQEDALHLLEILERQEANWSSQDAAHIARRIIDAKAAKDDPPVKDDASTFNPELLCLHKSAQWGAFTSCIRIAAGNPSLSSLFEQCFLRTPPEGDCIHICTYGGNFTCDRCQSINPTSAHIHQDHALDESLGIPTRSTWT